MGIATELAGHAKDLDGGLTGMGSVPGETEFIPLPPTRFMPAEPMS